MAFTWDEEAKEVHIYHNGRRYRHVSDSTGPMARVMTQRKLERKSDGAGAHPRTPFAFDRPGFDRFFVGCLGDGRQFDGLVDDFRIYSKVLTPEEVKKMFAEHADKAVPDTMPDYAAMFAKDGPNPYEGGKKLELDFVAEYRFDAKSMDGYRKEGRFRAVGDVTEKSLDGVPYLEAGTNRNDRFAFLFDVDPSVPLYCFDFVYPDDAKRTCDLLVQFKEAHGDDYTLQVGYFTGDEYPNTGKMLTHRCLYWTTPGKGELAAVAMTARPGVPAALSALRVYKVKDAKLPPLAVNEPKPTGGWNRMFGMYWEDPAIGYDFGTGGHDRKQISPLIDRTVAYMKYCGQNIFCYPGVWYQGLIGEDYNPRNHAPDFLAAWYAKFDREGLFFVPNVNPNNMEIPDDLVTFATMTNGTRRPDLKLWLNSFIQPDWNWPDFMEDGFMTRQAREGGLDREALAAIPNLILCQTQLPAFCRKRDHNLFPNDETYAFNRVLQTKPGFFALVKDARFPWINQHDLYGENPVGREKGALNGDGFVETKWRVTTINPSGYHALRDFVLPLRFGDVQGISKGGYLVGTYGMEEHLRAFAAAYRALPAVVMKEIWRQGNVVLRQVDYEDESYFYLVNTDCAQADVVLSVPDGTRNLVTGASLSGDVKLALGPYQLMSFAAPSGRPLFK